MKVQIRLRKFFYICFPVRNLKALVHLCIFVLIISGVLLWHAANFTVTCFPFNHLYRNFVNHAAVFLEPNFFSMSEKSLSAPDVNQPAPQEVGLWFRYLIGWYSVKWYKISWMIVSQLYFKTLTLKALNLNISRQHLFLKCFFFFFFWKNKESLQEIMHMIYHILVFLKKSKLP